MRIIGTVISQNTDINFFLVDDKGKHHKMVVPKNDTTHPIYVAAPYMSEAAFKKLQEEENQQPPVAIVAGD